MIFQTFKREEGCDCYKCGASEYEGIGTPIKRDDGVWDLLVICSRCLFTGGMSEELFDKALGKKTKPKPLPEPEPVKPRWFGKWS